MKNKQTKITGSLVVCTGATESDKTANYVYSACNAYFATLFVPVLTMCDCHLASLARPSLASDLDIGNFPFKGGYT